MEAHERHPLFQGFVWDNCERQDTHRCRERRMETIGMIRLYINHNIVHHIANDTNMYEMWQKLESMYERRTSMNKTSVIKRLAKVEYRDGTSVTEHLNVFQFHITNFQPWRSILRMRCKHCCCWVSCLIVETRLLCHLAIQLQMGSWLWRWWRTTCWIKKPERRKRVMVPLLVMHMWLKPMGSMTIMDALTQDFSKAKVNPEGDQSQDREKTLLAFIVAIWTHKERVH